MFQVYLPIAEMSVNIWVILAMGGAVGFLSGMFGVGGGFLITPLLIFSGIPPAVAIATESAQITATSVSGALAQWRRGNVDFKMGSVMLIGGVTGSIAGVQIVKQLRQVGQIDLIISLTYVVLLGGIGSIMLFESVRAMRRSRTGGTATRREHNWIQGLPLKMRFHRSRLYISAIPPVLLGVLLGLAASVLGVGGGFFMVPAMIYLLRMPTGVVIGTSLFQIIFVTALVTILHAATNQTVDMVLAIVLTLGGVIGAQYGVSAGQRLKGEQLRALLGLLVLAVGLRLAIGLVLHPAELFSLAPRMGGE